MRLYSFIPHQTLSAAFLVAFIGIAVSAFAGPQAAAATVSRAVIDFNETVGNRFILDNLIGDTTNIGFDELAPTPLDGLSLDGVTFGFQESGIPSPDAVFAAFDLGLIGPKMFLDGEVLEGSALGILTIDFAIPTGFLSFGFALNGFSPVPIPGATVSLFDAANQLIDIFTVNIVSSQAQPGFPEGYFEYQVATVPVPAALPLFVTALTVLGFMRRGRISA